MPLILPGNVASATAATGYDVANSCRFNDDDSAYLTRDLGTSTAGSGQKFTFSAWVKRGILGTDQYLFSSKVSTHQVDLCFKDDDTLRFRLIYGGTVYGNLRTNAKFRDVSGWYHIVVNMDTTQSTDTNRNKMYVNGSQVTSLGTSTRPNQNSTFTVNNNTVNNQDLSFGRNEDGGGDYFDGYMAEVVWIDGTAYAASDFGEYNEDSPNIWQPKDFKNDVTFGTHGAYLDFEDSGDLDDDESGNGNDFTATNLAAIDQCVDTCTNNFATMNPLVKANTALTFSQGNLKLTSGGGWGHAVGSIGVAHGKWYWEVDEINSNNNAFFGICNELNLSHLEGDSTPYSENGLMLYFYDGRRTIDGTSSEGEYNAWGTTHGFALDLDSDPRTIKFYKDNSLEATENLTANFPAGEFVFPIFMGSASSNPAIVEFNFGNPATALASGNNDANGYGSFEFSPPSGYIAICTKNLGSDGG